MLSPSGSDIVQQAPHQLLKVPFTSGVVKVDDTVLISTWKVTYAESAAVCEKLEKVKIVKKVTKTSVIFFFILIKFIYVKIRQKKINFHYY